MSQTEPVRDYLAVVLGMNPHTESEAIVERRRVFLRAAAAPSGPGPEPGPAASSRAALDRTAAQSALETLCRDFWTLEPGALRRELDTPGLERFPDLERTARRIRRALEVRDQVAELEQNPEVDRQVIRHLKKLVIAPRRDQARLRQQAARDLLTTMKILPAQSTENLVRRRYPEVRALAPEWFEEIRRTPRDRRALDRRVQATVDYQRFPGKRSLVRQVIGHGWWVFILVWILLRMLVFALRNG